jgi:hypothetical protein
VFFDPSRKRREKRVRRPDEVDVCRVGLGSVSGEREPRRASWMIWLADGMVGWAGLGGRQGRRLRWVCLSQVQSPDLHSLYAQRSSRFPSRSILDEIIRQV